ncbi:hypothetical protein WCLP8_2310003 [uncultured Gammaproteobacteria bacterium]
MKPAFAWAWRMSMIFFRETLFGATVALAVLANGGAVAQTASGADVSPPLLVSETFAGDMISTTADVIGAAWSYLLGNEGAQDGNKATHDAGEQRGDNDYLHLIAFGGDEVDQASAGPNAVSRAWDTMVYYFKYAVDAVYTGLTPPSPASFARKPKVKDPYDFWTLLGDAGYKLGEIEAGGSLLFSVNFKFKHIRELSSGDISYLERKLERHSKKFSGPISFIHRTIIHAILEVNSGDDYVVESLKIALFPIPSATFTMSTWEFGLSREHDELLRAVQGRKLKSRQSSDDN